MIEMASLADKMLIFCPVCLAEFENVFIFVWCVWGGGKVGKSRSVQFTDDWVFRSVI